MLGLGWLVNKSLYLFLDRFKLLRQEIYIIMTQHSSSCSSFLTPGTEDFAVYMFQADYERVQSWVNEYPDLETGGDLFGLWTSQGRGGLNPLIHIVLGPGAGCKRTKYSFHQHIPYLQRAGNMLTTNYMLGHIGEWHSHHQLTLFEPSSGDYSTVKRNYPSGFHGFLLIIANILPNSDVCLSPFVFREGSAMVERGHVVVLPRESPFRRPDTINRPIREGGEIGLPCGRQPRGRAIVHPRDPSPIKSRSHPKRREELELKKLEGTSKTEERYHPLQTNPSMLKQSDPVTPQVRGKKPREGNARPSRNAKPGPSRNPRVEETVPFQIKAKTSHSQWYSTEIGKGELSRIENSLKQIQGAENVEMHRDSENHDVSFGFTCRSSEWNIKFPSTYPHGVTVLNCLDRTSQTLKRTSKIQKESYYDNITEIISCIRSEH